MCPVNMTTFVSVKWSQNQITVRVNRVRVRVIGRARVSCRLQPMSNLAFTNLVWIPQIRVHPIFSLFSCSS